MGCSGDLQEIGSTLLCLGFALCPAQLLAQLLWLSVSQAGTPSVSVHWSCSDNWEPVTGSSDKWGGDLCASSSWAVSLGGFYLGSR